MDDQPSDTEDKQKLERLTQPGRYLNSDHPAIQGFASRLCAGLTTAQEKAKALYYGVRDEVRYNPYQDYSDAEIYTAHTCLERGEGYCVSKAALLAAAARAVGIPAQIGFADVRNHLTSPKLEALIKTDVFAYHGYTDLWLNGRWVKVTPTFNLELCEKFGVKPLEFDGENEAILHSFDSQGRAHMEYLKFRGSFEDVPRETIMDFMVSNYPGFFEDNVKDQTGDKFMAEGAGSA